MAAILIEETKRFTFTKDNYDIYLSSYQIILGMVRFTKIVQNTLRDLLWVSNSYFNILKQF